MESSYNKLKWKNGRDIGEDTMEIANDSLEYSISPEIKNSRRPS